MNLSISKTDTSVIKGIAILAMLVHHFYIDTANSWFLEQMQEVGKVCVALFVLLSGYGLCVGYQTLTPPHWEKNAAVLLVRRFVKFYFNYWAIFIIWVPIGIFVFGRTPELVYGAKNNLLKSFIMDFFAIRAFQSYNITWWFNKLIIILYLISPVVFVFCRRFPIGTFVVAAIMQKTLLPGTYFLSPYLIPFILGFLWALNAEKLNNWASKVPQWLAIFASVVFVLVFAYLRQCAWFPWSGTIVDSFLAPTICLLVLACKPYRFKSDVIFGFLGKHSINIYLMHTFVFAYFWREQIYSLSNKFLIFAAVLGICLAFSVVLEYLKKKLKYNQLSGWVVKLIEKE